MRISTPDVIIGVAPGNTLEEERLRQIVDIDLVFDDARRACSDLVRLLELRG
jgi:hypothetical protein